MKPIKSYFKQTKKRKSGRTDLSGKRLPSGLILRRKRKGDLRSLSVEHLSKTKLARHRSPNYLLNFLIFCALCKNTSKTNSYSSINLSRQGTRGHATHISNHRIFSLLTTDKHCLLQSQVVLLKETRTVNTCRKMLLQKNEAALIPVINQVLSHLPLSSRTEMGKQLCYFLIIWNIQRAKLQMIISIWLSPKLHTKQKCRNGSAQSTSSHTWISQLFNFFLGSLCKPLLRQTSFASSWTQENTYSF